MAAEDGTAAPTSPLSTVGRPLIAFFYQFAPHEMPSYVRNDFDALTEFSEVRWSPTFSDGGWHRGVGPGGWLPGGRTLRLVHDSALVVQWFATPLAPVLAARALRRPVMVISGGYDVAAVPEIGYGQMLDPRTRTMSKLALKLATKILSISQSNASEILRHAPGARLEVLYLGFDPHLFPMGHAKERVVLTIGALRDDYVVRKGLDTFAMASRELPGVPFVIVGKHVNRSAVDRVKALGGSNLTLTGQVRDQELKAMLQKSAVYAQLSLHEAFGCAVAEAMLSGCTPVATPRGALPEILGDCGFYVEPGDPKAAAETIRRALAAPVAEAARQRIVRLFPLAARKSRLRECAEILMGSAGWGGTARQNSDGSAS